MRTYVTALKNIESPQPGFSVARSLKNAGHTVIGIDDSPLSSGMAASYIDEIHTIKALKDEEKEEFLDRLAEISKDEKEILIPCYDDHVYFFSSIREEIQELGFEIILPSQEALKKASKPQLPDLEVSCAIPKTKLVKSKRELESSLEDFEYPVVVKGIVKDAYIAHNEEEAKTHFSTVVNTWHEGSGPVLLQEHIDGEFYCVAGVANENSKLLTGIVMKKLGIDSKGTTWSGYSVKEEELMQYAEEMVEHTKWKGPFEMEFIKKDNTYYLFEINPRFPSWINLASEANVNMTQILLDTLEGRKEENFDYDEEIAFSRFSKDAYFPYEKMKQLYGEENGR